MAKYIPLDALVAEIEKLKDGAHNGVSFNKSRQSMGLKNELSTWEHLENAFATVLKIINTLEVKEVDLEKEVNDYGYHYDYVSLADRNELVDFAKHFFELGMQVSNKPQKGE